jgi:hypothetical protein
MIVIAAMAEIGNHGENGIWPTLEWATWLFDRASFGLIIGTVIVLASTVMIVWMGVVKEHHWDVLREQAAAEIANTHAEASRANEAAGKAHERAAALEAEAAKAKAELGKTTASAAEANARAAEATQKAAEAELALERLKAPRILIPQQQGELVQLMKQFTGTSVRVWTTPGTSDTAPLANLLAEILGKANLSVGTATSLSGRTFPGVVVVSRSSSNGQGCARKLVEYLIRVGIGATLAPESPDDGGLMPAANMTNPGGNWQPDIFVVVGSKI